MSSVLHAALVMLAPVAAAALVGLCWAHRASSMGWERSPESENKPLVRRATMRRRHSRLPGRAGAARPTRLSLGPHLFPGAQDRVVGAARHRRRGGHHLHEGETQQLRGPQRRVVRSGGEEDVGAVRTTSPLRNPFSASVAGNQECGREAHPRATIPPRRACELRPWRCSLTSTAGAPPPAAVGVTTRDMPNS